MSLPLHWWSTIAARTDNEVKNQWNTHLYWNAHLKKRPLRMGINPDTYAPAEPPTFPGATTGWGSDGGASSSSSAFPATRHMAQWESARLEAEARLSTESLLFSSAASASTSASAAGVGACGSHHSESTHPRPEPDFFLRIWNSEVGDAFRKPVSASNPPAGSSPQSSYTKQSTAVTFSAVVAVKQEPSTESKSCVSGGGVGGGGGHQVSGPNEVEDTSEETYQLYLDFAGDELGLFSGHLGGFSLFSGDLHDPSLDSA